MAKYTDETPIFDGAPTPASENGDIEQTVKDPVEEAAQDE